MLVTIIAILHVLLAVVTTIHILLCKSDVRSAIGWIGITWLSPFAGSLIYYAFGINRIARKAKRMRQLDIFAQKSLTGFEAETVSSGINIKNIAAIGNQINSYSIVGGNSVLVLEDGGQAYPSMLEAIDNAQQSIALSTYIFRLDETGQTFITALINAKNRGVEVRVLVDGIGSGYWFSAVVRQLKRAGIRAYPFMDGSSLQRMSFINLRNHKKLLIVDSETAYVGGLNLSSRNIFTKNRKQQIRDTHFCVKGPVVLQLMASFADDWYYANDEMLTSPEWWAESQTLGEAVLRCTNSGPDEDMGNIETILAGAINNAKHHIRIVTPYFLPDDKLKFLLELAVLRGVTVDLITPEKTDFKLMDWASSGFFSHMKIDLINCMRSVGVFDHSKLVSVDNTWCAFGSFNWDARSMCLNFEIMVESYDRDTVANIDRLISKKKSSAYQLTSATVGQRSALIKLRDASARLLLPYL